MYWLLDNNCWITFHHLDQHQHEHFPTFFFFAPRKIRTNMHKHDQSSKFAKHLTHSEFRRTFYTKSTITKHYNKAWKLYVAQQNIIRGQKIKCYKFQILQKLYAWRKCKSKSTSICSFNRIQINTQPFLGGRSIDLQLIMWIDYSKTNRFSVA